MRLINIVHNVNYTQIVNAGVDMSFLTNELKSKLGGLPSFCRLFIYEALEYCDYEKGVAYLPALHEMSVKDFHVERASGRKREEVNENTLRNTIRTIKKFRGDDFKFRVVNQRIEIDMPWMRELSLASKKDAGGQSEKATSSTTPDNIESEHLLNASDNRAKNKEDATSDSPNNNIFINKYINNNNNLKGGVALEKKPIAEDFTPSEALIAKAKAKGYEHADCEKEIQKFILHNQACGSRFADFEPVYLLWLQRGQERSLAKEQQKQMRVQTKKGRSNGNHASNLSKQHGESVASVLAANPLAAAEIEQAQQPEYTKTLGCDDTNLRPAVREEIWCF